MTFRMQWINQSAFENQIRRIRLGFRIPLVLQRIHVGVAIT